MKHIKTTKDPKENPYQPVDFENQKKIREPKVSRR
jgi:hypothetical protein